MAKGWSNCQIQSTPNIRFCSRPSLYVNLCNESGTSIIHLYNRWSFSTSSYQLDYFYPRCTRAFKHPFLSITKMVLVDCKFSSKRIKEEVLEQNEESFKINFIANRFHGLHDFLIPDFILSRSFWTRTWPDRSRFTDVCHFDFHSTYHPSL